MMIINCVRYWMKDILIPTDNDLGASPVDYMEEIFNDEDAEKVPTGYFELDAVPWWIQKGKLAFWLHIQVLAKQLFNCNGSSSSNTRL